MPHLTNQLDHQRLGAYREGSYTGVKRDGTLRAMGLARCWEDIQGNPAGIKRPASSSPTWRTYDFGLGGLSFAVLGFAVGDYADFIVQTKHSMPLESELRFHIHYTVPSDSADDKFQFQVDAIAAGVDEDFAVPSDSPLTGEDTLDGDEARRHSLLELGSIDGANTSVSSLYLCRLTRIAATSDEYGSEIYVLFNDQHYLVDMLGSRTEYHKWTAKH